MKITIRNILTNCLTLHIAFLHLSGRFFFSGQKSLFDIYTFKRCLRRLLISSHIQFIEFIL